MHHRQGLPPLELRPKSKLTLAGNAVLGWTWCLIRHHYRHVLLDQSTIGETPTLRLYVC
jgi:hypothetical protein